MATPPFSASFWDGKYQGDDLFYGTKPNDWLAAHADLIRPDAQVLVPGDGEGRNGVWLAEQGAAVTTLDLSEVAVAKARRLAEAKRVRIDARVSDLFAYGWEEGMHDAVVLIFLHLPPDARRRLHHLALRALRPGGFVLVEGFTPAHLANRERNPRAGGPGREDMLFTRRRLREDFAGARVRELAEESRVLSEGDGHDGEAAVIHGVFEKV